MAGKRFLFEPISLSGIELRNRIVFTSVGIDSYNADGTVTDENLSFVRARSRETGMIITTVSMATYKYGKVKFIGSYDDYFIPSLSRFAEAGHDSGAKIVLQLSAMGGPNTLADDVFHEIVPYVPSADIPDYQMDWKGKNTPVELETIQVKEIIDDFIQASLRAKKSGFDGVEIFAAEDFLLSSFITPHYNRRVDQYGGNLENMLRMPVEIIEGIRKICGKDFIIGFKYNAYYEFPEGDGIDLDLGVKIGQRLAKEEISYLHAYSYAKHDKPFSLFKYSIMASQYQPRNSTIPVAEKLKEEIKGIPIMAVGSVLKPEEAEEIIRLGKADLVSIGRAFIADHLWASKARNNQDIRPCIRCFVCLDEATNSRLIACTVNPDVLASESKILKKTEKPKKILVAGAGPAGINFALYASARGHEIILCERAKKIGGQLLLSIAGGLKYEFGDLLKYFEEELENSRVKVLTGIAINETTINKLKPDLLVLAIGAKNKVSPVLSGFPHQAQILNIQEAIFKAHSIHHKRIIILGGQDYACETALVLKRNANDVSILEENDQLMSENNIQYLTMVLERMLVEEEVRFYLKFKLREIKDKKIIVENLANKNTFEMKYDLIINALGFERPMEEISSLMKTCPRSFMLGDCEKPEKLFQAISGAFDLALMV